MRRMSWTVLVLGFIGFAAAPVLAQEKKEEPKKEQPKKEEPKKPEKKDDKGGAPGGSDMDAMMAEMIKLGMPGEHHKHMTPLAGKWNLVVKYRMSPTDPWTEEKSTAELAWMFDGRFMTQKAKGDPGPNGEPAFEGFGILGYDNTTKKHTSVWCDNMGTMMMTGEGTCSGNGKEITLESNYIDPRSGEPTHSKWVYKIESNDKFLLTSSEPGADGKEFTSMEITYTRAK